MREGCCQDHNHNEKIKINKFWSLWNKNYDKILVKKKKKPKEIKRLRVEDVFFIAAWGRHLIAHYLIMVLRFGLEKCVHNLTFIT